MKTTASTTFNQVIQSTIKDPVAGNPGETLPVNRQTESRYFSAADLWSIQRSRRIFVTRRGL